MALTNSTNYNHNYIGNLMELCQKLKISTPNFNELGANYCNKNINAFKFEAKVQYENQEFTAFGEQTRTTKKMARQDAARNCLIKFLKYLKIKTPTLDPKDYGLTENDLLDHRNEDTNSTNQISNISTQTSTQIKTFTDLTSNGIHKKDQNSVCLNLTSNKVINPFSFLIDQTSEDELSSEKSFKRNANDEHLSTKSNDKKKSTSIYAKAPDEKNSFASRNKDLDSLLTKNLNGMKLDEKQIIKLDSFQVKNRTSKKDSTNDQQKPQSLPSSNATDSSSVRLFSNDGLLNNGSLKNSDSLNDLDPISQNESDVNLSLSEKILNSQYYLTNNKKIIESLFEKYDLKTGNTYSVLIEKLVKNLPKFEIHFQQRKTKDTKISCQMLFYDKLNMFTVFSELNSIESILEECSKKMFQRLLEFSM